MNLLHWRIVGTAIFLLWCASLMFPAIALRPNDLDAWPGWALLLIGPLGAMVLQFGWFANVLGGFAIEVITRRDTPSRKRSDLISAFLALFGVNALFLTSWPTGNGGDTDIIYYGPGYFMWITAVFLLAVAILLRGRLKTRVERQ